VSRAHRARMSSLVALALIGCAHPQPHATTPQEENTIRVAAFRALIGALASETNPDSLKDAPVVWCLAVWTDQRTRLQDPAPNVLTSLAEDRAPILPLSACVQRGVASGPLRYEGADAWLRLIELGPMTVSPDKAKVPFYAPDCCAQGPEGTVVVSRTVGGWMAESAHTDDFVAEFYWCGFQHPTPAACDN
jgi:hypothetical protein